MNHRVIHRAAPLACHLGRPFIRTGQRRGENQFVFQRRTHPLAGRKSPHLPDRSAPALLLRILPVPDLKFDRADHRAQMHRLLPPMMRLASAPGEKLRRSGWLLLGVVVPVAGASIRALLPALPVQSHAGSVTVASPSSCNSFRLVYRLVVSRSEEPIFYVLIMVGLSRRALGAFDSSFRLLRLLDIKNENPVADTRRILRLRHLKRDQPAIV